MKNCNLYDFEQQKKTFIATLTHDLNPPAIAQMKALELVLNNVFGEITPIQREILTQTYNSCKYMHNMISALLATYKYDDEMKILEYSSFDINELVKEVYEEINWFANDRNLNIELCLFEKPIIIKADKTEIHRVLTNLISNAISYSIGGSKVIIKTLDKDVKACFTVNNNSRNISLNELEKLFDRFCAENVKFRQVGTGVGLYLSKMIINAHKGHLIIKSDETTGNTFGFELLKKPSNIKVL